MAFRQLLYRVVSSSVALIARGDGCGPADFVCVPAVVSTMDRADDRGSRAITRVQSAPRVTLNWLAEPFVSRGMEETKWIREKNGRRVLKRTSIGGGKAKYWRAPRPRAREHRRRRRGGRKAVLVAAFERDPRPRTSRIDAHVAMQVLQDACRKAHEKTRQLEIRLQEEEEAQQDLQLKLNKAQAASKLQQGADRTQASAQIPHLHQSMHLRENFGVTPQQEPMTSVVENLAWLIGMFCLGVYCHYTWMLVP